MFGKTSVEKMGSTKVEDSGKITDSKDKVLDPKDKILD
jgi:hypothetical protein